jgi:uncharacterized protein (DUF1499 family)
MGGAAAHLREVIGMRRPMIHEPMSRLALWSGRLALFALAVVLLSIIVLRSGLLEIVPALATFAAALIFAALAVLFALLSFIPIWRQGYTGLGRALMGLVLGLALLAYPGYFGYVGSKLPAINDITTDFDHPPQFDLLARLRPRGHNDYPGAKIAALQEAAYPDIEPLEEDAAPDIAYRAALGVVTKRKWLIVDARAPTARRDGIIEAVARTLIMGFRDDVVVRVSADDSGSRIDARSASRYGVGDFGTNAARVRALLSDIDDAISEAPTEPQPAPAKKPPPKRPAEKRPTRR